MDYARFGRLVARESVDVRAGLDGESRSPPRTGLWNGFRLSSEIGVWVNGRLTVERSDIAASS